METILSVIILVIFFLGYQLTIKHNYRLIVGYNFRDEEERYPKKVEEKMCRYIGSVFMLLGLLISVLLFVDKVRVYKFIAQPSILVAIAIIIIATICMIEIKIKIELEKYQKDVEATE